MRELSRRSLLASTGLALGGSALLGSEVDLTRALQTDSDRAWPQGQHDARKTGAAPDIDAPTGKYLQRKWTLGTYGLGLWDQPAIVDGTMYAVNYPIGGAVDGSVLAVDTTDGSVQWKAQLADHDAYGWPEPVAPAVAAGIVCIPTEDYGTTGLNAETGEIEWQRERVRSNQNGHSSSNSAPALVGSTVFVPTQDNRVVALDITTGSTHREYSAGRPVSSVAVTDETVVASGSEGVVVLERASGETAWTFDTASLVDHVLVADEHVFAVSTDGTLHSLDLASGDRQWSAPIYGHDFLLGNDHPPTPSVTAETLVVSTPTDALEGSFRQDSALVARDTSTGDVRWTSELLDGRATIAGSYVYVTKDAKGIVVGDLATGDLVTWYGFGLDFRLEGLSDNDSSYTGITDPVVVDGTVYCTAYSQNDWGARIFAIEPADDVPEGSMAEKEIGLTSPSGEPYTVGEELTMEREGRVVYWTDYNIDRGVLRVDFDGDGTWEWSKLVPAGGLPDDEVPTWTYDEPGEYEVTAKFLDEYGRSTTATETITIVPESELPDMGESRIEITEEGLCGRLFIGSITGEGAGDLNYFWEFDDEPIPDFDPENDYRDGEDKRTSFYATERGTYYVRLVVEDDEWQRVTTMKKFEL